jgi:hypothetical protein
VTIYANIASVRYGARLWDYLQNGRVGKIRMMRSDARERFAVGEGERFAVRGYFRDGVFANLFRDMEASRKVTASGERDPVQPVAVGRIDRDFTIFRDDLHAGKMRSTQIL